MVWTTLATGKVSALALCLVRRALPLGGDVTRGENPQLGAGDICRYLADVDRAGIPLPRRAELGEASGAPLAERVLEMLDASED